MDGDIIEISAGYVFEDSIFYPNNKNVSIRGAGPNETIIDAELADPTSGVFRFQSSGQTHATVISDLTIQKDANQLTDRGAVWIDNTSPLFRNVEFRNNYGDGFAVDTADVAIVGAGADPRFEQCRFIDARGGATVVEISNSAHATLINCAFDQSSRIENGQIIPALSVTNASVDLINCTLAGELIETSSTVDLVNSVLSIAPSGSGGVSLSRCLYPGATGDNIDGVPSFINEAMNDLRLTESSLGVDAADYDAYVAAGGGGVDAGRQARAFDAPNTNNTGTGVLTYLDMGAYEYFIDSDGDGIGDASDVCPGFDDTLDADGDGTPDDCDSCPFDLFDDSDGDGVCNSDDVCPLEDDTIDTDGDSIPDCAEAVGDECAYAESVGNGTFTGTMDDYSGGTGDDTACASNDTIDRWFRYVSSVNGTLTVSTCNPGTEFNTTLAAYDGCPAVGGQQLFCEDNSAFGACFFSSGENQLSQFSLPVTIGQTVYVRLSVVNDNFFGMGGFGTNYEISFVAEGDGDECEIARAAFAGVNFGTMADNTGSTGVDDTCGGGNSVDEWFAYTPTVSGDALFSTCSATTGFNTVLSLFDDCPASGGVELGCNDNQGSDPSCELEGFPAYSEIVSSVTAGQTYYLRVSGLFNVFEPNGPGFDLIVIEPAGCTLGDLDGDQLISLSDVTVFVSVLLDPDNAIVESICAADVNEDGAINGLDTQEFISLLVEP